MIRTSWSKANPGKLYYACTIKCPNCDWIRWINDHKCDCQYFTMKLEAENHNLKLLLIISWIVQAVDAVQLVMFLVCKLN
ncbi:hypothetical protein LXL04_007703 [Taraxacum kok-saghyz]